MRKTKFKISRIDKKLKSKINCEIIEIPLYHCSVQIIRNQKDKAKIEKEWELPKTGKLGAVTRNYLEEDGNVLIIFNNEKPSPSTLAHEFTHVAQMVMKYIGHNHCKEDYDEPTAYLVGYLVSEFHKKPVKKKKVSKKK